MESCFFVPLLAGKTEDAIQFATALNTTRRDEYTRAQLTCTKESWFVQQTPVGDFMIVYFVAPDGDAVMGNLAASEEPFDLWFKDKILELTGIDCTQPMPGGLPQQVLNWSKQEVAASVGGAQVL